MLEFICRAIDVSLFLIDGDTKEEFVVRENDWESLTNEQLIRRVCLDSKKPEGIIQSELGKYVANAIRPISRDGVMVGRTCLLWNLAILQAMPNAPYGMEICGPFFSAHSFHAGLILPRTRTGWARRSANSPPKCVKLIPIDVYATDFTR